MHSLSIREVQKQDNFLYNIFAYFIKLTVCVQLYDANHRNTLHSVDCMMLTIKLRISDVPNHSCLLAA